MDKRLPVTENTHSRMTAFAKGAGMTYDQAVNLLLDIAVSGEAERAAGARLRYEIEKGERPAPTGSDDETEDDSKRPKRVA